MYPGKYLNNLYLVKEGFYGRSDLEKTEFREHETKIEAKFLFITNSGRFLLWTFLKRVQPQKISPTKSGSQKGSTQPQKRGK